MSWVFPKCTTFISLEWQLRRQNVPRIRTSEPPRRLVPHWQCGKTQHQKFTNVFDSASSEKCTLEYCEKWKKRKNIYCRGLTLTLSEMGITLYLPHLVSVHARFVLLDNSSIYWRQTITNFFDKQFFFHLTLYSAQLRYFIKRFSRVLQDLHRWHQNLSRKFCKATQTVCLKRKRQLLFAVTHWLLGLFSSTHQLKSQELSWDEFTILSKVG